MAMILSVAASYVKSTATIDYEFYKKNHLNFSANSQTWETGCLSLLGGCHCLNIQVMPWVMV
jgi:hypothetical protein